jgi:predicted enzyme related to lactoylglutathione lyase
MSNRVTHFEIMSDDPKANIKFFKSVFGWKFIEFDKGNYWLAETGTGKVGINGAIMKQMGVEQPVINTIEVEDIDKTIKKIAKAGGEIVKGKEAIPKVGWLAFFSDTDGIIHGIMQLDKKAK